MVYPAENGRNRWEGTNHGKHPANGSAGACLRQSVGAEDHSGDWNEYPAQQTITAAGCTVTLKGETGSYTLAIWTDGNYSYSLSLSSGQPESVWQTIIEGVQ